MITATQSIDDYHRTEGAKAAWENSDWAIAMRQKPEAVAQFEKNERLSVNQRTAELIRSLTVSAGEFSEMVIIGPHGQYVGRLALDRFSVTLSSSDAEVFARIEALEAEGASTEDAAEAVAFNRAPGQRETQRAA